MLATHKLYTGQRRVRRPALGLFNYKPRFYSTVLGRSRPSPIVSDAVQPPHGNGIRTDATAEAKRDGATLRR